MPTSSWPSWPPTARVDPSLLEPNFLQDVSLVEILLAIIAILLWRQLSALRDPKRDAPAQRPLTAMYSRPSPGPQPSAVSAPSDLSSCTARHLRGRNVLVTGSTQGVGKAIATSIAAAGANVVIHGLYDDEAAKETIAECLACGVDAKLVIGNLLDGTPDKATGAIFEAALNANPKIDTLVNNAGGDFDAPVLEMTYDKFDKTQRLNVYGYYFMTQHFARHWVARGTSGRVLMTGSINGKLAEVNCTAYDVSKGAVEMMVKTMAVSLAPHRIRVNGVAPGLFYTPLTAPDLDDPKFMRWMQTHTPNGAVPGAEVIGEGAVFLLSDAARHMCGHMLMVDGGMSVWQQPPMPPPSTLVVCGAGFLGLEKGESDGALHVLELTLDASGEPRFNKKSEHKQVGSFPLWAEIDKSGRFLYTIGSTDEEGDGQVHAYAIGADGTLSHMGTQSSQGIIPDHFSLSQDGKTLLVSNYCSSNVAALPVGDDGSLGVARDIHVHTMEGMGALPCRQEAPHPHMFQIAPDGDFAFSVDLGSNSIVGYKVEAKSSKLTRVGETFLHPGAGPRHMAFSKVAPYAYVVSECDNTVVALKYDKSTGALSVLPGDLGKPVSTLAENTPGAKGGGASEIVVSGDGRFAYTTTRETGKENDAEEAVFNVVATFALDTKTGGVTFREACPSGGSMPWSCAFAGEGEEMLLVTNQHARHSGKSEAEGGTNDGHNGEGCGCLSVFKRDVKTGKLTLTAAKAEVPQILCVAVAK